MIFLQNISKKKLLIIISLLAVVIAIPLTVFISQKQQEIRQGAAGKETTVFFADLSNANPPALSQISLSPNQQRILALYLDTRSVPINGYQIIVNFGSLLPYVNIREIEEGADAKQFGSLIFKDFDQTTGKIRFAKTTPPDSSSTIQGKLHLGSIAFTVKANASGNGTVNASWAEIISYGRDNPTVDLPSLPFTIGSAAAPQAAAPTAFPCPQQSALMGCFSAPPNIPDVPMRELSSGVCPTPGQTCYGRVFPTSTSTSAAAPTNTPAPVSLPDFLCVKKSYPAYSPQCNESNPDRFLSEVICSEDDISTNGCIKIGSSYVSTTCQPKKCSVSVPLAPTLAPTPIVTGQITPVPRTGGGQPSGGGGGGGGGPQYPPPTAAVAPGSIRFNLAVGLRAIGGTAGAPKHTQRSALIRLFYQPSSESPLQSLGSDTINLTYDPNPDSAFPKVGKFKGNVIMQRTLKPGTYKISIEIPGYLKREYTLGNIDATETTKDYTPYNIPPFFAGDISGDGTTIDILDYNRLIDCLGGKACPDKGAADINDDGIVNAIDYNTWLRELAAWRNTQR